jgi:hypothetical protein
VRHPDVASDEITTRWVEDSFLSAWAAGQGFAHPAGKAAAV